MPTTKGTVMSADGMNFRVAFDINGVPVYGSGRYLSSAIPTFQSKRATLTYTDWDSLTGTINVAGVVRKSMFTFVSEEDVKIEGNWMVALTDEIPMTGQITWASGWRSQILGGGIMNLLAVDKLGSPVNVVSQVQSKK